jgi:2-polyprenyl-3-methyl-5-hydroxy-6-metoxy-1,4-benzoquinol methylase
MPIYNAPVEDMMFLFEKLRDNKNYNEIDRYKEVTSDLVKDILEEAAKINQNLILPLAKAGDENPAVLEMELLEHLRDTKRLIKNTLKMDGPHCHVIQNMVVRVCQKQSVLFLMRCFHLQVYLLSFIVN